MNKNKNKNKNKKKIRKSDYHRVLVTETLPYETPIIFSNDGLYERLANIGSADPVQQKLLDALITKEIKNTYSSIPFFYKIRKNSLEFRKLALIHPRSQWQIKGFYEKYENLILYYCAISPATIRAPHKIAGSFFVKSSLENLNQYKSGAVSLLQFDPLTKHSPSFFAYKGYDRLYKFFESRDYFALEKHYGFMLTLDVSKCFDSIYTHSMSWAIKDKEFTKKHVGVKSSFAQRFDELMQHANHGETNGIVIGPEISRIFAEIIFQEIDTRVILNLRNSSRNLEYGKQYSFRRYVDDVFIFAGNQEVARFVYASYADVLSNFNLHANKAKSIEIARPFVTNKSRLIHSASFELNGFIEKFLVYQNNHQEIIPKKIQSVWRLTHSFIESIKAACSHNQVNYDEVAAYLISVLTERIKKLVAPQCIVANEEVEKLYSDAIFVLLDVMYFLYAVSPSVGASYKLCTSVILVIRFTKTHLPSIESSVFHRIYELTESLMSEGCSVVRNDDAVEGFVPLEMINVILAARELGDHYLMEASVVESLFDINGAASYFSIISCLFYIRDESRYGDIKVKVIDAAVKKLADLSDLLMNSEKAYLLLDLLSCRYIPEKKRKEWVVAAYKALGLVQPSQLDLTSYLSSATTKFMQINWDSIDLLNALEKKELKQVY
ncbi:MAG: antiviral reverse transcriptase Drt3b [Candidatus Nitrotoga sp.]|nr:antiviral reverse transcriptase Drt3b [Candidatus Nitrotoga sp.]MDP3496413.1 antiviral reverse transcriptase Drt3b [Candidatus Nitrotoga sp.]